ncbi:MAG: MCE family protein [Planctomycetales bacterium]|nr:MCE family protein [Planctomycetales bacterium]
MDERRLRIRVGIVVFAAVIVSMILVVLFGLKPQFLQPQYTVKIGFPRAPGVSRDTPIRKSGVEIGRVSDVLLRDNGDVLITMRIDKDRQLRMNERARISMGSLVTGDAVIEFVRDETDRDDSLIGDGELLPAHGGVAGDPLEIMIEMEDRMTAALKSIESAGASISTTFAKIEHQMDAMMNEGQIQRIAASVEDALNSFTDVMMAVENVVGDPELINEIKGVIKDARPVVVEANKALQSVQQTADAFRATAEEFGQVGDGVKRNLDNIEKLTAPLGQKGAELLSTLEQTAKNADQLIAELVVLSQRVNRGEGTVGKLVTDDELHERIAHTLANIEYLSQRLRPIVDDVRVFTDKVARDPGTITSGVLGNGLGGLKTGLKR